MASTGGIAFEENDAALALSLRPTLEGSSLLIRGFPGGVPKPYEEVLTFLRKGTMLQKYGRHGNPKYHFFRLGAEDTELQWESKNGRTRRVPLAWVTRSQRGQDTDIFKRYPQPSKAFLSFSILYVDAARKERSLDVICNSLSDFEMWYWGIQVVRFHPPSRFQDVLRKSFHVAPLQVEPLRSLDGLPSSRTPKPGTGTPVGSHHGPHLGGIGGGSIGSRRDIGDLYIWGSLLQLDGGESSSLAKAGHTAVACIHPDPMANWQQSPRPVLVYNTGSVNVVLAACGTRHAALISRAGELYTWGYGAGGSLGQGSLISYASPRRVEGRWVKAHEAVLSTSASDSCTAAVTSRGNLYTWGKGLAGQLGHGDAVPVTMPKLVSSFVSEGLRIAQVSCAPYHTAAVTTDGQLFTWGNGLFGKLGHGDNLPAFLPRKVVALEGHRVISVSCGWWHTAAVATPRTPNPLAASSTSTLKDSGGFTGGGTAQDGSGTPAAAGGSVSGAIPNGTADSFRDSQILLQRGGSECPQSESSIGTEARRSQSFLFAPVPARQATAESVFSSVPGAGILPMGMGQRALHAVSITSASNSDSDVASLIGMVARRMESSTDATLDLLGGGVLFTWGGDFSWAEPSDVRSAVEAAEAAENGVHVDGPLGAGALGSAQNGAGAGLHASTGGKVPSGVKIKMDHHKGCLGTGDKEGRLVPTRVRGELDGKEVVQVACGWNLTVAVTRDGRVFQMGSTGAYNPEEEKGGRPPAWEGCLLPTQVDGNLFGMFIEEVAVGMHHVAAVASKLHANGRLPEEGRRSRLLTWGKGAAGQLGNEVSRDFNSPQVVSAIDGRRIINVACGGNHTLVVCEHDPRDHSRHHHRHAHQPPRSYPSPPASLQNGLTGAGPMSASNLARSASAAVGAVRSSAPHIPSNLAHSAQGPLMGGQSGVPAHVLNHSVSGLPVSGALASSTVASWLGSLSSSVSAGLTTAGASSRAPTPFGGPPTYPAAPGSDVPGLRASSAWHLDERQAKLRATTASRVVGMPALKRRDNTRSTELFDGDLRHKQQQQRRTLATNSTGHQVTAPGSGHRHAAHHTGPRRTLSSHLSSGALSSQSSPARGLAGEGGLSLVPSTDNVSPTSSVSGLEVGTDPGAASFNGRVRRGNSARHARESGSNADLGPAWPSSLRGPAAGEAHDGGIVPAGGSGVPGYAPSMASSNLTSHVGPMSAPGVLLQRRELGGLDSAELSHDPRLQIMGSMRSNTGSQFPDLATETSIVSGTEQSLPLPMSHQVAGGTHTTGPLPTSASRGHESRPATAPPVLPTPGPQPGQTNSYLAPDGMDAEASTASMQAHPGSPTAAGAAMASPFIATGAAAASAAQLPPAGLSAGQGGLRRVRETTLAAWNSGQVFGPGAGAAQHAGSSAQVAPPSDVFSRQPGVYQQEPFPATGAGGSISLAVGIEALQRHNTSSAANTSQGATPPPFPLTTLRTPHHSLIGQPLTHISELNSQEIDGAALAVSAGSVAQALRESRSASLGNSQAGQGHTSGGAAGWSPQDALESVAVTGADSPAGSQRRGPAGVPDTPTPLRGMAPVLPQHAAYAAAAAAQPRYPGLVDAASPSTLADSASLQTSPGGLDSVAYSNASPGAGNYSTQPSPIVLMPPSPVPATTPGTDQLLGRHGGAGGAGHQHRSRLPAGSTTYSTPSSVGMSPSADMASGYTGTPTGTPGGMQVTPSSTLYRQEAGGRGTTASPMQEQRAQHSATPDAASGGVHQALSAPHQQQHQQPAPNVPGMNALMAENAALKEQLAALAALLQAAQGQPAVAGAGSAAQAPAAGAVGPATGMQRTSMPLQQQQQQAVAPSPLHPEQSWPLMQLPLGAQSGSLQGTLTSPEQFQQTVPTGNPAVPPLPPVPPVPQGVVPSSAATAQQTRYTTRQASAAYSGPPPETLIELVPPPPPPAGDSSSPEAGHDEEQDLANAPLVQPQHPFAAAVAVSPRGPADSLGSGASSVADLISAAGPAMLRTKAANMLARHQHHYHHRRAQSVDVSRLSYAVSSPTSGSSNQFQGVGQGGPGGFSTSFRTLQQPLSHPASHALLALGPDSGSVHEANNAQHVGSPASSNSLTHMLQQHMHQQPHGGGHAHSRTLSNAAAIAAASAAASAGVLSAGGPEALARHHSVQGTSTQQQQIIPRRGAPSHSQAISPAGSGGDRGGLAAAVASLDAENTRANAGGLHHKPSVSGGDQTSMAGGGAQSAGGEAPQQYSSGGTSSRQYSHIGSASLQHVPGYPGGAAPAGTGQGSKPYWVEEPVPGVYLWLQRHAATGGTELFKIRFSRRQYSSQEATDWWLANKEWLSSKYVVSLHGSTNSSTAGAPPGGSTTAGALHQAAQPNPHPPGSGSVASSGSHPARGSSTSAVPMHVRAGSIGSQVGSPAGQAGAASAGHSGHTRIQAHPVALPEEYGVAPNGLPPTGIVAAAYAALADGSGGVGAPGAGVGTSAGGQGMGGGSIEGGSRMSLAVPLSPGGSPSASLTVPLTAAALMALNRESMGGNVAMPPGGATSPAQHLHGGHTAGHTPSRPSPHGSSGVGHTAGGGLVTHPTSTLSPPGHHGSHNESSPASYRPAPHIVSLPTASPRGTLTNPSVLAAVTEAGESEHGSGTITDSGRIPSMSRLAGAAAGGGGGIPSPAGSGSMYSQRRHGHRRSRSGDI